MVENENISLLELSANLLVDKSLQTLNLDPTLSTINSLLELENHDCSIKN